MNGLLIMRGNGIPPIVIVMGLEEQLLTGFPYEFVVDWVDHLALDGIPIVYIVHEYLIFSYGLNKGELFIWTRI